MTETPPKGLCDLTQEEVDSFLSENEIKVHIVAEPESSQGSSKIWGFTCPKGFHAFTYEDSKMTEAKAQYMTMLLHKLLDEYHIPFSQAEALSMAYVMSEFEVPHVLKEKRPRPDMSTEEGQEEVRNTLLNCIKSGNVIVASDAMAQPKEQ